MSTPLATELRRLIALEGPLPVARYMALCLGHPRYGYYPTRDPLGAAGDFTTAPEISQMFGELLGLWAAAVFERLGSPTRVLLVELGPGRGTLMADALRAARLAPAFRAALSVHLVETSPTLRRSQREALADAGVALSWHEAIDDVPDGPLIVLANEFFDALPVSQAVKAADGWHERMVGIDAVGQLAFGLHPLPLPRFEALRPQLREAPPGAVYEWRDEAVTAALSARIAAFGGAALVIDYGHGGGFGDTLQAVRAHGFVDPLAAPGAADLTAHVDFAALASAARRAGADVHGPLPQRDFLLRLGIEARAARLNTPAADAALARLIGTGPGEMGVLFKVLAFADPRLGVLPGFERV